MNLSSTEAEKTELINVVQLKHARAGINVLVAQCIEIRLIVFVVLPDSNYF